MIKAKLYAIGAAIVAVFLAAFKLVLMQRDAAREDARRAKKHMTEVKEIRRVEKQIKADTRVIQKKAVEDIKHGKVPDNIRNRNDF